MVSIQSPLSTLDQLSGTCDTLHLPSGWTEVLGQMEQPFKGTEH